VMEVHVNKEVKEAKRKAAEEAKKSERDEK
jgi:hypothetical protein